jgi:hypothetical protein
MILPDRQEWLYEMEDFLKGYRKKLNLLVLLSS